MIQELFYTAIAGNGNFEALAGTRIYPLRIPQGGVLPAAVYQIVNSIPVQSLSGDSNLDSARVQITCWADSYAGAQELAAVVRNAVNLATTFKSITQNVFDTEDPETKSYGVILEFMMWAEVEDITPIDLEYLLLETGDNILLETGDLLALEV